MPKLLIKRIVRNSFLLVALAFMGSHRVQANQRPVQVSDSTAILGRWDLTINIGGKSYPSWLEVHLSGIHMLVGRFVGIGGSARPISRIQLKNGILNFSIPPQWESSPHDLKVESHFQGTELVGTMVFPDGKTYPWTGVRAPSLHRFSKPVWGNPIPLFDGKDLKGWHSLGPNQWIVEKGIMRSPHSGSNLVTDQSFRDFKLHIEFRYPKNSNSGVYLRGRYEVQIVDNPGPYPWRDQLGAIYGFLPPNELAARPPGQWQSYDITLVGRLVTVIVNGKTVICRQIIPGITGGALDSKEGNPGPILLQGDHGPIDYRNIVITPALHP